MNIQKQISAYFVSLDEPKRSEMQSLHQHILQILPEGKLWFLNGKDETGKVITNPSIGYGQFIIHYKNGTTKEFYQIGISGNTMGISVYIMGLEDKKYLNQNFGTKIGKASVTGYCIKFKTPKDVNIGILEEAIRYGVKRTKDK